LRIFVLLQGLPPQPFIVSPITPVRQPRFAFPFRKKGQGTTAGAEFSDEHEFHKLLKNEPLGAFGISPKGMWHGGIHVSEGGAGSALDLIHGVRCIADGEVVAFRINSAYLVSQIAAQADKPAREARYSTGFALVRHAMEFPKDNKLTFFSLYMHLRDLAGYESDKTLPRPAYWSPDFKVTQFANDKPRSGPRGVAAEASQVGLRVRASRAHGTPLCILPRGTQISIAKREGNWGQIKDTHGAQLVPPAVGGYVAPTAAINGWVFMGQEGGHPIVEEVMPDSRLDRVVTPEKPIQIKAGDLIGHLGRYDSLSEQAETSMVHLEVFCGDGIGAFIEQGRNWVDKHGHHPENWAPLGLPSEPTILRVGKNTKLYKAPFNEGQDAPLTDVVQLATLVVLAKNADNRRDETEAGTDGKKRIWWRVQSANVLGHDIDGWVRQENFAGGRVTLEHAQSWIDFDASLKDPHDPTHTMFSNTKAYVDYMMGADVPAPGALDKLSPLMAKVYRTIYPRRDESRAADELRAAADDRWRAQRMSRLIIRHESEWANPGKWRQLIQEIEKHTGAQPQHEEELKRIGKLVWWDEVSAGVRDLPGADVFHIHPVGAVGNFARAGAAQSISEDGIYFIFKQESLQGVTNKLHWPGGASGVTLGPGYDMKARTADRIIFDMKTIGLDDATAQAISEAAELAGQDARNFCIQHGDLVNLSDQKQVELLRKISPDYEGMVVRAVKVDLQQHEFDALVSYAYNSGGGWTAVTTLVNQGDIEQAMNKIRQYVNSGGVVFDGLKKRRDDEITLFTKAKYQYHGVDLPRQ